MSDNGLYKHLDSLRKKKPDVYEAVFKQATPALIAKLETRLEQSNFSIDVLSEVFTLPIPTKEVSC